MSQNLSSAAVVIGALRVKKALYVPLTLQQKVNNILILHLI